MRQRTTDEINISPLSSGFVSLKGTRAPYHECCHRNAILITSMEVHKLLFPHSLPVYLQLLLVTSSITRGMWFVIERRNQFFTAIKSSDWNDDVDAGHSWMQTARVTYMDTGSTFFSRRCRRQTRNFILSSKRRRTDRSRLSTYSVPDGIGGGGARQQHFN